MPSRFVSSLEWLAAAVAIVVVGGWYARRSGRRALLHFRARVDRFKLASRKSVRARLLGDSAIASGGARSRRDGGRQRGRGVEARRRLRPRDRSVLQRRRVLPDRLSRRRVGARICSTRWRSSTRIRRRSRRCRATRSLVYLMNHRSNADYVLVSYALAGQVAISYAVGEWARAFPLEHMFKAFGSYFVRRRVPRAVVPRGARAIRAAHHARGRDAGNLSRGRADARRASASRRRSGCSTTCSASRATRRIASRMHIVPVAINYDRVLEDRSLLRELASRDGRRAPVARRRSSARWRAISGGTSRGSSRGDGSDMGAPPSPWARRCRSPTGSTQNPDLFELPRAGATGARARAVRSGHVADRRADPGDAGAARVRGDSELRPRLHSAGAISSSAWREMRDALVELNGRVVRHERRHRRRRSIARGACCRCAASWSAVGDGYVVLPRGP